MSLQEKEIQLTIALVKGDIAAFDALYELYHHAVYANISRYIVRQDISEDILQEVFLSLWLNRHSFHQDKPVGGWLFVVSHNKALSCLRKMVSEKKALQVLAAVEFTEEEIIDEAAYQLRADLLNEAINILPPAKKEIFRLCKLQGKTYNEAAALLNISPAVVKESLRSASKMIRNYLSSNYTSTQVALLFFMLAARHAC